LLPFCLILISRSTNASAIVSPSPASNVSASSAAKHDQAKEFLQELTTPCEELDVFNDSDRDRLEDWKAALITSETQWVPTLVN
jgi:hypothetical protein